MAVTSTRYHYAIDAATTNDNWGIVTGTSTGTNDIQFGSTDTTSATTWGISPIVAKPYQFVPPQKGFRDKRLKDFNLMDKVPRIHKDKNGCVKKSYWETQPIEIGNYGFAGISDLATYTSTQTTDHTL